ncbi:MAG: NADH-quinone oxidoreductase subunit H, partial [Candidatus Aenigmatarchaeota archaeon]
KTEFSSRGLALIELSRYMKLLFFIFFTTFLFFGPMHIVPFLLISLAMLFLLTLEKVTTPRYRVEEVFKFFIPVLALALIEITRLIIL